VAGPAFEAIVAGMSPRTRVYAIVGAAAAAAALAVTLTVALGSGGGTSRTASGQLGGRPPLELDLGVRGDAEAVALRRASAEYPRRPAQAAAVFRRYRSLDAQIGSAMAAWPHGTIARLERLSAAHPRDSEVRLNLGIALFWSGRRAAAEETWRDARRAAPDTLSAVRADDLLHPRYNKGLPTFVPGFHPPTGLAHLRPDRQLAALARAARNPDVRAKLIYGVALQRLGRPRSAERMYAAAARLAPDDPEAQVAAAVGRFDKDHPERAFSRLGPLAQRFPHAPTVRFHLGLLLLWLGQLHEGTRQLRLARAEGPSTPLGREAQVFLRELGTSGRK
jgi:tetratricopeptide (TPR) repeat protein